MLVNDVYGLQNIIACLFGNFALSQDIRAPFSVTLEGDHRTIKNLYINRLDEDYVGLFGNVSGVNNYRSTVKNLN